VLVIYHLIIVIYLMQAETVFLLIFIGILSIVCG